MSYVWCQGEDEHLARQPAPPPNRSYWSSPETWASPDCIECGGEGAPCCDPPDHPYEPDLMDALMEIAEGEA